LSLLITKFPSAEALGYFLELYATGVRLPQ
jgi:hypothetical protein